MTPSSRQQHDMINAQNVTKCLVFREDECIESAIESDCLTICIMTGSQSLVHLSLMTPDRFITTKSPAVACDDARLPVREPERIRLWISCL